MEAVVAYLEDVDPEAARRARYACFDQFGRDPQVYAYEAGIARAEPCEHEVVEQLLELRERAAEPASRDGAIDADGEFYAEQNARLVANAERYYRAMFRGGIESWNPRDRHNLGQLVRERAGGDALLVGFTTYRGTVTAASDWGGPAERTRVRRALPGSGEELFHQTERASHYFHARIAEQFDAVIHIDETGALEPLETTSEWQAGELPETYPWGV